MRRSRTLTAGLVPALLLVAALAACAEGPVGAGAPPAALDLRDAPWLEQADGSPSLATAPPWPSLIFAPGVTYAGALERLWTASRSGAPEVADAQVAQPLPREVVYVAPGAASEGLRLSLLAPWGWADDGRIRSPSLSLPSDLPEPEASDRLIDMLRDGAALPEGVTVDVPELPPCQVGLGSPDARPPC